MLSYRSFKIILVLFFTLFSSAHVLANDSVKLFSPSWGEKSTRYKHDVLLRSLELTRAEYGPYTTQITDIDIKPKRLIALMQTSKLVNVAVFAANEMWDKSATAIRIPIRGGTLSYRLLLVKKQHLSKFENVSSLNELRKLVPGLLNDWSTTGVLEAEDFKVVKSQHFEGLFSMLETGRIDYIPRGVYEIYDELSHRQAAFPDITIEPTLALRIPMVTYVYVAPTDKRLAERLTKGITLLSESGELRQIFNKYYESEFTKAKLSSRKIIDIESEYFNSQQISDNNLIWNLH